MSNAIAVVSADIGGYDGAELQTRCWGCDYLFFSDRERPDRLEAGWDRVLTLPNTDPPLGNRKLAKIPKVVPHVLEILREYKYVVWIDGSMTIISPAFVDQLLSNMTTGMVASPHFDHPRDCAYSEAEIRPPKYANEPLDEQVAFMKEDGFPEHLGLYECGVAARDMGSKAVRDMSEIWMEQILRFSYQDQVSFPYALWKSGFQPDVLPASWRTYRWIKLTSHKSEL